MNRTLIIVALVWCIPSLCDAANWANVLFDKLDHDFGAVQRGTKLSHDFVITNTGSKDVRIRQWRVSCSCVSVSSAPEWIRAGESIVVRAVMDTTLFQGPKSVTIYVNIDKPRRSLVSLQLSCVSQQSTVAKSSQLDFGVISAGSTVTKKLNLDYSGGADWQITRLDYGSPALAAEVVEVARSAELVRYELAVTLKGSATIEELMDRIRVVTNDANAPFILIDVKARIEAKLTAAPLQLQFGKVTPGAKVTRNVLVKSDEPFRILRVEKTGGAFEIRSAPERKKTQLVVVTLSVPATAQEITDHLEFVTDLPGEPVVSVNVHVDE